MKIKIKDRKTKKFFLDADIGILKEGTINDLELLIVFKIAFISASMEMAYGQSKTKNFDQEFYNKLKIELKILEANKKHPENKMVKIKEVLNKFMISNFDKNYILDILEM